MNEFISIMQDVANLVTGGSDLAQADTRRVSDAGPRLAGRGHGNAQQAEVSRFSPHQGSDCFHGGHRIIRRQREQRAVRDEGCQVLDWVATPCRQP